MGASGAWLDSSLPESWFSSLLVDGVWAGVGAVVIFLPQILVLFLFLGVLEDSGYLGSGRDDSGSTHVPHRPAGTGLPAAALRVRLRHTGHPLGSNGRERGRSARHHLRYALHDLFGQAPRLRVAHRRLIRPDRCWDRSSEPGRDSSGALSARYLRGRRNGLSPPAHPAAGAESGIHPRASALPLADRALHRSATSGRSRIFWVGRAK